MPSHRRMRSYFLKLAHTFSTPISSLSSHARSKHKHDHDFLFTISSETKINDKLLPLPWLSLSTTPSSTFFLSFLFSSFSLFSSFYVQNGQWEVLPHGNSSFHERRLSQSDLLPVLYARRKSISLERVHVHQAVVGIPARDGWKKFSLSGTGQTKLVILCKRCCVSGGKRLQIETASVFALCGSWILLPLFLLVSVWFPDKCMRSLKLWLRSKSIGGNLLSRGHTSVIIRNDSNNSNSNPLFPRSENSSNSLLSFIFIFLISRLCRELFKKSWGTNSVSWNFSQFGCLSNSKIFNFNFRS